MNDNLDDQLRDQLVVIGKGVASLIPLVGGPLAEIIGVVVPGQRADRIVEYLRKLASRVDELDAHVKDRLAANADKIDLIEEGGYQAARATTQQRIEQIVEAVSRGLKADDSDIIRRKRLLRMLSELDDDQVSLLNAYGRSFAGIDRNAFDVINRPNPIHLGSTPEEIEQDNLYQLGRESLLKLGLLEKQYSSPSRGQSPEFDTRKGDFKHSVQISGLGRMLLKEIGLETPFDAQSSNR
ncbi:hypothetical protein [Pseudonocardia sp. TMWB2A]|uniref:hypothetical protein n=1 Tax=Pseudonocardia sp. TMWB2A TaxID=687430 RepID=UPI00307EDE52